VLIVFYKYNNSQHIFILMILRTLNFSNDTLLVIFRIYHPLFYHWQTILRKLASRNSHVHMLPPNVSEAQ